MIERVALEDWVAFDAAHPAPTFFARPAWSMALATAFAHMSPHAVRVRTDEGWAIVPLMHVGGGRLGWKELVGMPMGAYTCALLEDGQPVSAPAFAEAAAEIARHCDTVTLIPWPLGPVPEPPNWRALPHETAAIDLSIGYDAVVRGVDGVTRRMAGQAERRGVVCEPAASAALGVATYYGILRESSERWGLKRPPFPKELLEALISLGNGSAEIWLAQCDKHPIAGGVVLYGSQELFFWSAAMRYAYARMRPSNALNFALIRHAATAGVRWYNLGASAGLPGVERFKRGLGARNIAYSELHREGAAFGVYTRLRSSLRRRPVAAGPV